MKVQESKETLESYFEPFRNQILGGNDKCTTPYGNFPVVYADWIAEGRLYQPIEENIIHKVSPFIANPHSYSSYTGQNISEAYSEARRIIRKHINAGDSDILVTTGHGMTGALQRLIQILDLRFDLRNNRPAVFITHMEHHSNHTTWEQCGADIFIVPPDENGIPITEKLREMVDKEKNRKILIGSFTGASNVTGIITPYHELASIMHSYGGLCFVDFAASAPYVNMDMNPPKGEEKLDAVFFAPHKFLGGPGSCGVLVFDKEMHSGVPSLSGGGNVKWTQPTGGYGYSKDIETQEDGGTPAYLQTIRTALAIKLKEKMGVDNIKKREEELLKRALASMKKMPRVELLACDKDGYDKIGVVSFNISGLHYNLIVRLLNDRFGIQTRGGWSCASTYSHYLFNLSKNDSNALVDRIESGDFTGKPGWVRISLHPTMTDADLDYCLKALDTICKKGDEWGESYSYNSSDNEYYPRGVDRNIKPDVSKLFEL